MDDALARMDAMAQADLVRRGEVRPLDLVDAAIRRIERKADWYCDNIALDSLYDYETFWERCVELGVAVTQHAGSPLARPARPFRSRGGCLMGFWNARGPGALASTQYKIFHQPLGGTVGALLWRTVLIKSS